MARQYGTGSVSWLSPTKARLRIRVGGERRTKMMTVSHRDRGGRGEANEALQVMIAEAEAEKRAPRGSHTLGETMDAYVGHLRRIGRSPSTVELYGNVRKQIPADLATLPLSELTAADLDGLYGTLAERGLKASTIRTTHASVRAALNQAVKWVWWPENAARNATPPANRPPNRPRIDPGEVWAMIDRARQPKEIGGEGDIVLAMAIFLATYAGGRRGELCGLRWDGFDAEAGTLTFAQQWVPETGGQRLAALKSETGALDGKRTIALGAETIAVLERFREHQRSTLEIEPEGWLLSHDGGSTPLNAKVLGMSITKLARKMDLKVTTHSFRRTSATQIVGAGVDVDTASRRLGHTKQVMLRDYVLGADDRAVAAAEALETRLVSQGLPIAELLAP